MSIISNIDINIAQIQMNEIFEELTFWTNYVLPKDGETWEKKPCGKCLCSMGHSLGAGVHKVDFSKRLDWGTCVQIKCGCLVKVDE